MTYATRIGMSHKIDRDGVTFLPGEAPGNALAQFEAWIEKIVQEEVEKRTAERVSQLQEANEFALSENARMKNALEEIEQVGHNPAHLACDLMDAHPDMEERLWALVNRLASMANQQVCIAHENRKALYCNEGPQGSNWFDVMARLRHAILPEINADSTFLTVAQVRTLVAEIEKLESLVAEANREAVSDREIYLRAYKLIGACDISNFLAKCEQASGFEERECDLECEITRLKQIISNMEENL